MAAWDQVKGVHAFVLGVTSSADEVEAKKRGRAARLPGCGALQGGQSSPSSWGLKRSGLR